MEPLPERTEHDGLVFRRWTPDDAFTLDALVQRNREHLRPYMPWIAEEPLGPERRRALLQTWEQEWRDGGDVVFGIFDGDDSAGAAAVGATGLHRRIGPSGLEIGYWVDADHLGQGIARRASEAMTSLGFTVDGIDTIEIHHDLTNVISRRIPEQLGFRHVGQQALSRVLAPAESGIELMWRMGRDEWVGRGQLSQETA